MLRPEVSRRTFRPFSFHFIEYRSICRSWWKYEAITFKLADDTRYTPDFAVMLPNGEFEIHETKGGFIREDGWQKLKIAAGMFPFRFFLCQKLAKKDGGGWKIKGV